MISKIRETIAQPQRPTTLSLRENQIIQGKITKIYTDNKAEIQLGNHKLTAEILTPLSVGKQYFFQVQAADHIQLKVLGEQSVHNKSNVDVEILLNQLGLKATKGNVALVQGMVQERIPFSKEQLAQAFPLLTKTPDKAEGIDILKEIMTKKLPLTNAVFQSIQINRQTSMTNLLHQVYSELAQSNVLSEEQQSLMKNISALISRPSPNRQPVITQQLISRLNQSSSFLNTLKSLGMVDFTVTNDQWSQEADKAFSPNENAEQKPPNLPSMMQTPKNAKEAGKLNNILKYLDANHDAIQKSANKLNTIFGGLRADSLSHEQSLQAQKTVEQDLLPLLPKEIASAIQQQLHSLEGSKQNQQLLFQVIEVFSDQGTFQELATITATEVPDVDRAFIQQPLQEQFLTHLRHYLQTIGMSDEFELKMNAENPEQLKAMATDHPSIKSMLLNLVYHQDLGLGDRAQALIHFINGMQMQSVTEVNHLIQASFMLPAEKLALNQDIYMQFEGKKDDKGKINSDHCRILFVLDLANMKETMIDMHIQKRIISVTIYNEQNEPIELSELRPLLKNELEKLDYQLSAIKWKPLYEQNTSVTFSSDKEKTSHQRREGFDFLI